jgi:hypothetical protein
MTTPESILFPTREARSNLVSGGGAAEAGAISNDRVDAGAD